jgi:murein DD-endopeptidase MepM/ murein hydrolase activator NlpD
MKKWIVLIIIIVVLAAGGVFVYKKTRPSNSTTTQTPTTPTKSSPAPSTATPAPSQSQYALPVKNFLTGQTKKPFGIYITPATSPVQPERFTGYHTGVDIEQVQDDTDVPVYAINAGTVRFVGQVSGYGGVLIYQTSIDNQTVTILYGHIRLSSATKNVGDTVSKGEKLAVLGSPYSSETDGERKHLHFSIHKGSQIVYLGYVQNQSELSGWLNPDDIIK